MEEFFNTKNMNFVALPGRLVCVKRSGLNEVHLDIEQLPGDENLASLKVDLERHTVYGDKYVYTEEGWVELDR